MSETEPTQLTAGQRRILQAMIEFPDTFKRYADFGVDVPIRACASALTTIDLLTATVAEQAQEIAAKETMIAATDAEAVKALLLLTDAEAKLREQAQEIERLRREWEDAVERERRLAPSLADTQMMARDAQAKLSAVEALRDELLKMEAADIASADESPFAVGRQLVWPGGLIGRAHGYKNAAAKLTAILTEAQ